LKVWVVLRVVVETVLSVDGTAAVVVVVVNNFNSLVVAVCGMKNEVGASRGWLRRAAKVLDPPGLALGGGSTVLANVQATVTGQGEKVQARQARHRAVQVKGGEITFEDECNSDLPYKLQRIVMYLIS
jgi:hypothetical protein